MFVFLLAGLISEPSIQCTVIQVHSSQTIEKLGAFPKLYQSINNEPFDSKLVVAGQNFPLVNPRTLLKTETFEKIQIDLAKDILELELAGKPLSRQGTLKINGKVVAEVTCH